MKAKELVGKVAVRTQPALFERKGEIRTTNPEILKIDERFLNEPVKILKVTEHNILIKVVGIDRMAIPPFHGRAKKIVLPEYFLDGNWESAEPFKSQLESEDSSILFKNFEISDINTQQEMSKLATEMTEKDFAPNLASLENEVRNNVNSAFADAVNGPEVDVEKVKDFVDLIFPDGEIDMEDKDENEIVMEMISKLKGLEPDRAKEVLDIIVDVAETMATNMLAQQERVQEKIKKLDKGELPLKEKYERTDTVTNDELWWEKALTINWPFMEELKSLKDRGVELRTLREVYDEIQDSAWWNKRKSNEED